MECAKKAKNNLCERNTIIMRNDGGEGDRE